jgi:hypothetical protein
MYWSATGTTDFAFADYCIATTGTLRTKAQAANMIAQVTTFSIFPNPINADGVTTIVSPDNGKLVIYDLLGRIVSEQDLVKGNNNRHYTT